jgi:hypothetical protein
VIELLPLLGAPEAAIEVGLIRDILVELKKTGKKVRPSLFPTLF